MFVIDHLLDRLYILYIFYFSGSPVHFDDIGKFLHDVDFQLI